MLVGRSEFTAYHESAHWVAGDSQEVFDNSELMEIASVGVKYAISFVALQAAQLYFKKPFAVNSVFRGLGSLAMNGIGAWLPTVGLIVASPRINNSGRQQIERQADITAAKTLCLSGKFDVSEACQNC